MSKQSRKSKNELDIILEQLKRSYSSDTSDSLEDVLLETPKREEDEELNEILNKIFGDGTDERVPFTAENHEDSKADVSDRSDIAIAEETEPATEQKSDDVISTEEESSEVYETKNEPEATVTDQSLETVDTVEAVIENTDESDATENSELEAVDNILNLMFSSKSSSIEEDKNNAIKEIINSDNGVDATVEEETVEEDALAKEEFNDSVSEDEIFEEYGIEDESIVDAFEVQEEYGTSELEDQDANASEDEEAFAVADEEYSLEKYYDTRLDELYEKFERAFGGIDEEDQLDNMETVPKSAEPEKPAPRLVLSRSEYTYDPLQETLPVFGAAIPQSAVQNKQSDKKTSEKTVGTDVDSGDDIFNENDISLLLKFGYDSEVKSQVGEKKTQSVMLEPDKDFVPDPHKKIFGFCGKELNDRRQIPEIKDKYKTNQRNVIILLSVVSILSLFVLFLSATFEFSANKEAAYPFFVLIEFSLVLVIMTVLYKKLLSGINKLIKLEITANTLLCVAVLAYVLYTLMALSAYLINADSVAGDDLILFGFTVSIYAVLSLVADLLNCIRQRKTFSIIADSEELYTAENESPFISKKSGNNSGGESKNYVPFVIRKVKLISGYFRKTSLDNSLSIKPMYIIGIVPAISLVFGSAVFFASGSFMLGVAICMLTVLFCIPVSYVITPTVIDIVLSSLTTAKNIAFIGDSASEEISKATSIVFFDSDTVDVVDSTEIRPDGSSDSDEFLKIAYEILAALGGPLSKISAKNAEIKSSREHELIINEISENGIDVYFNSSVNVLMGNKRYMQLHNIKVKTDSSLLTATKGAERSVLFITFDGVPRLGFIINSRIKPEFLNVADIISASGRKIFVRTYEPQLNDTFFEQNKGESFATVTVKKPEGYERPNSLERCDGLIVSGSDALDLAKAMCMAPEITRRRKINKTVNSVIALLGVMLSGLVAVFVSLNTFDGALIEALRSHMSTVFTLLMLATMIPALIEIVVIKKKISPLK